MSQNKSWLDKIADLLSGRIHNTILSLNQTVCTLTGRINIQENKMTENEQLITRAAQAIDEAAEGISQGVEALLAKIDATEGVNREDLSEELAMLTNSITKLQNIGGRLTPSTPGALAAPTGEEDQAPEVGGPLVHPDVVVTPLAGESGPTDAGYEETTQADPVAVEEVVEEPVADESGAEEGDEVVDPEDDDFDDGEDEDDFEDEDEDEDEDADTEEVEPGPAQPAIEGDGVSSEVSTGEGQVEATPEPTPEPVQGNSGNW